MIDNNNSVLRCLKDILHVKVKLQHTHSADHNKSIIIHKHNAISIYSTSGSTSGSAVTLKTGRREVPGSNPGRACRPSRSEFSAVFSETRVNTVLKRPRRRATHL